MIIKIRQKFSDLLLTTSISAMMLCPSQAMAQQAASSQGDLSIGEIIVTAQKRNENVQSVPAAVSVISSQLLGDLHATQLTDLSSYVPALQVNSAGSPGQTTISIRGIAPIGVGSTVATYIDDSPIGSSSTYGGGNQFQLDLLPYDVQRVEVLRGPQGTLYGASSMGGLLKYVLTTPALDKFEARIGGDVFGLADAGRAGGGVRASLSAPIVSGKLGLTASYALEDTPGFIDNSATGRSNQNSFRQESGRLGLYWQPSEALSVNVNGLYQRITSKGDANVALDSTTLQPISGNREDNNLTDQPFRKTIKYVSGSVSYKNGWAEIVSATSYSDTRTSQTQDASYTYGVAFPFFGLPAGSSAYNYKLHLKKFAQELRVQSLPDTKLEWLAGVFYTNEKSSNIQSPSALTIGGAPIAGFDPLFVGQLPTTYKEYAAFGDLTYNFSDRFQILGGVRYSRNRQLFSELLDGPLTGSISILNARSSESVTTYSAGAKYHLADKIIAYVRVATGYRPGGPNLAEPGVPPTFGSDKLTNYEVGVKSQFLDNRLLLDVAAFRIDWNKIQLLSNAAGFNHIVNGGSARSQGIEANATIHPVHGMDIDGTFAYVDSKLTQDVPELGGLDGDRLPNISRFSGSVRASYTHALSTAWRGTLGAGVRFVGARYSDVSSAFDARRLPGYSALDLNASVTDGRYTLQVFARNVADKHAYLSYNPLVNQGNGDITQIEGTVLQPRVVGLSVDARF